MILILSLSLFSAGSLAYAEDEDILVELKFRELQQIDKETQEYPLLKQVIEEQKNTIKTLEKALSDERATNKLSDQELELMRQKEELRIQELAMMRQSFNDMKEIADRAIKLAEVSKPKSNIWTTVGLVLGGIVAGIAIAAAF
jgi:hypothetical protein